jgi:hypothetical protein
VAADDPDLFFPKRENGNVQFVFDPSQDCEPFFSSHVLSRDYHMRPVPNLLRFFKIDAVTFPVASAFALVVFEFLSSRVV